jgi:hypothetical protein
MCGVSLPGAVCIKVINDIREAAKEKKTMEEVEAVLQKVCAKKTEAAEKKLVRVCRPACGARFCCRG